ncbi:MAG: hypothetical protein ABJZ54_12775, partial [Luteolibacter sp.]
MSEDPSLPTDSTEITPPAVEVATTSAPEADLGKRIAGALIDSLVAIAVAYALSRVSSGLYYPAYAAYMLTRDSLPFLDGQSIGKKAVGTRAVSETGESLSGNWNSGIIRNVPMIIPIFPLVELIILIIN